MSLTIQLHVDILRARNYPQTEDDPCACSTFLRLFLYRDDLQETLANTFTTDLQENSNAPFYSASVDFDIPAGVESVVLIMEVVEVSRKSEPYVMFYGSKRVSVAGKGRNEEVIALTCTNPVESPDAAAAEAQEAARNSEPCPVLSIRYQVLRHKAAEEVRDVHADVELPSVPSLTGASRILPKDSQYVWVNLTSDTRWTEAFRHMLVYDWKDRAPLLDSELATENNQAGGVKNPANTTKPAVRPTPPVVDVRSIGDVIIKKWCCCRSHEVLTCLRLSAEAFNRGEKSLYFTRERELSYRLQWKERVCLLQVMTQTALAKMGDSDLRDIVDRLWIFFSTGIKHDPSGTRVLNYEVRKKVRETGFDNEDKAVLQSSVLNFLVPSLTWEECTDIAVMDMKGLEGTGTPSVNNHQTTGSHARTDAAMATPAAEVDFAMALVTYIGALLDTLTETELVAALKAFEPAVVSARQRLKAEGKEDIRRARDRVREPRGRERKQYKPGEGIKIDHLDILGRRKKSLHLR